MKYYCLDCQAVFERDEIIILGQGHRGQRLCPRCKGGIRTCRGLMEVRVIPPQVENGDCDSCRQRFKCWTGGGKNWIDPVMR